MASINIFMFHVPHLLSKLHANILWFYERWLLIICVPTHKVEKRSPKKKHTMQWKARTLYADFSVSVLSVDVPDFRSIRIDVFSNAFDVRYTKRSHITKRKEICPKNSLRYVCFVVVVFFFLQDMIFYNISIKFYYHQ